MGIAPAARRQGTMLSPPLAPTPPMLRVSPTEAGPSYKQEVSESLSNVISKLFPSH